MRILLTMKNWIFFTVFFIVPYVSSIAILVVPFTNSVRIILYSILLSISASPILVWLWSINRLINQIKKRNVNEFYTLVLVLQIIFILSISAVMIMKSTTEIFHGNILVLLIAFLLSIYYSLFCTAKSIRDYEINGNSRFLDYLPIVFGLGLFPIGIWSIQKRVNSIANDSNG
jgi:hypothetical protein